MPEDTGYDRATISEGLTADFTALEKELDAPPVVDAEVTATPEEVVAAPETDTPAPDPEEVASPEAEKPMDNEEKADRLRHADYTRKTMALAEQRREVEAMKAQLESDQQLAKIQAQRAALPALPEDDPYAQTIKVQQDQLEHLAQYQAQMQAQMREQMEARELQSGQAQLDALEKQVAVEFKLDAKQTDRVMREYWVRSKTGEQITPQDVAKERRAEMDALMAAGEKAYKEKHRVQAPAASVSVPGAAPQEETLVPGSRGFREKMREEIAALIG